MNAYELADKVDLEPYGIYGEQAANMLRQQADRIEELEKDGKVCATCGGLVYDAVLPQIKKLSDEEIKPLLDRIQNYLECGGLFNPECMEHNKVRDLIMDCKAILKKASEK